MDHSNELSHQFDDLEQQKAAADLGMWSFLLTEVLFFGGLFLAYAVYRWQYHAQFVAASEMMDIKLGAINTLVLLTSSLTMAMAVHAAHDGDRKKIVRWILVTMFFGTIFLGVKAVEYSHKFHEHLVPGPYFHMNIPNPQPAQIYFSLYFAMTGLHALHMIIGLGILTVIAVMAHKGKFSKTYSNPVEISGLYWHFVDIVWIFLYPLLYLIGTR
jgi:cytochrome c oxidase subunit III